MKLVNPSCIVDDQKEFDLIGIKKHIEKCARVCYKSENNITENSCENFVFNLIKRGHSRPLEFGTVYLHVVDNGFWETEQIINFYSKDSLWSRDNQIFNKSDGTLHHYITTNFRVIIENGLKDHLKYICDPTEYHYKRHTVHFVLSRGCMDDFRTHVSLSHLGESTRYCNYTKNKFGGVTFVIPQWCVTIPPTDGLDDLDALRKFFIDNNCEPSEFIFLETLHTCETAYQKIINNGGTPQEAREVLPLSVKSELISCGFEDAWENFFMRRTAPDAQVEAQVLSKQIKQEFIKNKWIQNV